ncbi:hypothetical protein D9619_010605 [Psilocybe cf. subviscida]|uniref:O-methyltransferase C-terminal domain-containing protein n=1 Tax=Psilocybe cf. subviscida TaxID=2480587 RepID=A0A8H5ARX1_9AGAR|nr:hypothetical protein D9619_010605 [Psilocybe cf. subviscida]
MTIAVLRSLHAIIGEAIDDIERVYSAHESNSEASSRRETPDDISTNQDGDVEDVEPAQFILKDKTTLSSSQAYVSPPPSPCVPTSTNYGLPSPINSESSRSSTGAGALATDFPSLDAPCDLSSPSEMLTAHPDVQSAIGKIVAAAGQLSATAQIPFLTLCEVTMGYHLPSCMRLLEASHVVEILQEAGSGGAHVQAISDKNGVSASKLAHTLRLLATHHLLREVSPDVFALNRLSSLLDTGKTFAQLKRPEMKYRETNGIAAFAGLCTDEIQKASAYMTETYYLSSSKKTREGTDPVKAPFCVAFDTMKSGVGYFNWLEGDSGIPPPAPGTTDTYARTNGVNENLVTGRGATFAPTRSPPQNQKHKRHPSTSLSVAASKAQKKIRNTPSSTDSESSGTVQGGHDNTSRNDIQFDYQTASGSSSRAAIGSSDNNYRLERFGKAMSGTDGWEAPGAVLNGFDWAALPIGSIVVDVGGGIGSTSMLLATAFSSTETEEPPRLKFIIQDRPVVCEMGEKVAWKEKYPKLLESTAQFQAHDFFTPQPIRNAAVFLLRVVLHDWPDNFARRILLHLREAATPDTKLVIADFILPLACPDDIGSSEELEGIEGAESMLAPSPLLPNLGKASVNVYYMDLTMQVMFNSQERTLREMVALTYSAGWRVIKVARTPGSHLGNIVATPVDIPHQKSPEVTPMEDSSHNIGSEIETERKYRTDMEVFDRAGCRCGTPTFGSGTRLSSVEEALARFGGGLLRSRLSRGPSSPRSVTDKQPAPPLKPPLNLFSAVKKKMKPSPLSVPSVPSSPPPLQSPTRLPFPSTSPRVEPTKPPSSSPGSMSAPRRVFRRLSAAHLHRSPSPPPPLPSGRLPTPSPLSSPRLAPVRSLFRRASVAHLRSDSDISLDSSVPIPLLPPSYIPVRTATAEPSILDHNAQLRYGSGSSIGSSASGSRKSSIRRASTAQLPNLVQGPFRKRSGTVTAAEARTAESGSGTSTPINGGRNNSKGYSRLFSGAGSSKDVIALASAPHINGLQYNGN